MMVVVFSTSDLETMSLLGSIRAVVLLGPIVVIVFITDFLSDSLVIFSCSLKLDWALKYVSDSSLWQMLYIIAVFYRI